MKQKELDLRKSVVENKYNLKPEDIEKAIVLQPEQLHKNPFWRNSAVNAWVLSETTAKNSADMEYGTYNEYWLGFYDTVPEDGKMRIRLSCSSYGGMCGYVFREFFNPDEIECLIDLEIQEKLLLRINWLLDNKIIRIIDEKEL